MEEISMSDGLVDELNDCADELENQGYAAWPKLLRRAAARIKELELENGAYVWEVANLKAERDQAAIGDGRNKPLGHDDAEQGMKP